MNRQGYTSLIDPELLAAHRDDPAWVIVDTRFRLDDTAAGRRTYEAAHIPSAVYAHLDDDLSGPPVTDHGRHPLPTPDALNALFRRLGVDDDSQVVVYDDAGGMIASRLWWMLRYMGHTSVAVLDGGWPAWEGPTRSGVEDNPPGNFQGAPQREWLVQLDEARRLDHLVDARAPERFRGEYEPLDARAGHIPGALNYHYARNLASDGRFLDPATLRAQLAQFLDPADPAATTFYCGSGVSACHNLLALHHAGLGAGRLYVGSWSEYSKVNM